MIEFARPGGCVFRSSRAVGWWRWSLLVRVRTEAAAACGASRATGYRLWRRYREGGWAALADRPPVPQASAAAALGRELEQRILAARAYAKAGPVIVAGLLGLPASTVWKVLRRHGVSRLAAACAAEPVRRYERERPGELVHVDIKKLGRFWTVGKRILGDRPAPAAATPAGSTSTSRSTTTPASPTPSCCPARAPPTASPSSAAPSPGTPTTGSRSSASSPTTATATAPTPGATTCADLGIARRYTRPRRPQTNGKAEALVKTLLREWAYRFAYPSSAHRALALPGYLRWYNHHRPHSSLGGKPPISRVSQVCRVHISARSSGVIRKITSTVNLVPKGSEVNGACG